MTYAGLVWFEHLLSALQPCKNQFLNDNDLVWDDFLQFQQLELGCRKYDKSNRANYIVTRKDHLSITITFASVIRYVILT